MSDPSPGVRAACFGLDPDVDGWPSVSVVVPVRNEGAHLERAVTSILAQDYPLPFDVCLAVAPSDDDTAAVATALAERDARISVVGNPAGVTPAGLNAAIEATDGSIVVRVDGHAILSDGYIRRAVATMRRTGAVNVGGVQAAVGETPFERAVAAAMTSWMGTGGSRFHVGGDEGEVDTVYLGVFDRAAGDAVGWFDESLIRNQDYELNIRLRRAGGMVWFDPRLSVSYRPRGTWRALATQYFEYGVWKSVVIRSNPQSLKGRQAVPAAVTPALLVGLALGVRRPRWLVVPGLYASTIAAAAWTSRTPGAPWHRVALALATIQQAWGVGFMVGAWRALRGRVGDRAGSAATPSAS